jgi:hypothetical protein
MDHRSDKQLWMALLDYANEHKGRFPSGEATPEASLSLIGAQYAYLLRRRDVSVEVVQQILENGQLLTPETCGWNYVEGLRLDSNPDLALFWDKEGLSEMGQRLPEGGHHVQLVGGATYVSSENWARFLDKQRKLLAVEKAKKQKQELPGGTVGTHR